MSAKRDAHLRKLASVYSKWRRDRYNLKIREECVVMADNKFTPPTHNMKKLPELFSAQLKACITIQKASRVWHAKAVIKDMMKKRAEQRRIITNTCAFMIQMEARRYIARKEYNRRLKDLQERIEAATFLQKYYRNRKNTLQFLMKLLKEKKQKEERELKVHMINRMIATWRMIMVWREVHVVWRRNAIKIEKVYRGHVDRVFVHAYKYKYARLIQRAWNGKVQRTYLLILLENIRKNPKKKMVADFVRLRITEREKAREKAKGGFVGTSIGTLAALGDKKGSSKNREDEFVYRNPGLDKNSKEFNKMKLQRSVIFEKGLNWQSSGGEKLADNNNFSSIDAHLMSNLLQHTECQIR